MIERKRVTWGRKELGSKAPVSFHTTDQKVRGSNPFGRTPETNLENDEGDEQEIRHSPKRNSCYGFTNSPWSGICR